MFSTPSAFPTIVQFLDRGIHQGWFTPWDRATAESRGHAPRTVRLEAAELLEVLGDAQLPRDARRAREVEELHGLRALQAPGARGLGARRDLEKRGERVSDHYVERI